MRAFVWSGVAVLVVLVGIIGSTRIHAASQVAITADGRAFGSCMDDVKDVAFFNDPANWGAGAGKIGPSSRILLCGTFAFPAGTNGAFHMTAGMSGAEGDPVVIAFDRGAIVQSDAFGDNGAFQFDGNHHVVLDGGEACGLIRDQLVGCNGIIQNLKNGVPGQKCRAGACSVDRKSSGVSGGAGAHDIEVRNLEIRNIYMELGSAGHAAGWGSSDILFYADGARLSIHNNVLRDSHTGVNLDFNYGDFERVEVSQNYIAHHAFGVGLGNGNDPAHGAREIYIHDNEMTDWNDWNLDFNTYHTDGLHAFTIGGGTGALEVYFYNNYVHGNLTGNATSAGTAFVYCDLVSGGDKVTATQTCHVFNNVFDASTAKFSAWNVSDFMNRTQYYNNTLVGSGRIPDFAFMPNGQVRGSVMKNNVVTNFSAVYRPMYKPLASAISESDYNVFHNCTGKCFHGVGDFEKWQDAGYDKHSVTEDPALRGDYTLGARSKAIGAGVNLSSVCQGQSNPGIGALCFDKAGVPRPATGPWDAGAFQFQPERAAGSAK